MPARHTERGGEYFRVADVDWEDPLDGSYSMLRGGRWNPPGSFPVVYLCASTAVARANVARRYRGLPYGVTELAPGAGPDLVSTSVTEERFVDVVSDRGCTTAGLPRNYPLNAAGREIPWSRCQPLGQQWWDAGEPGVACRSAALLVSDHNPPSPGEELAWFDRRHLAATARVPFDDWFWG
jgi:hypothetical protein